MTAKAIKSDALTPAALCLSLSTLWAVTHRFRDLSRDGELYAFQAMARINPPLHADLYLQNASQDDYTFFSPLYAGFIRLFGLQTAEVLLFVCCALVFFAAAWRLAQILSNSTLAWFSVAMLMTTAGYYGASTIFSYAEPYLTARSAAEGLAVAALAVHYSGRRNIALVIAVAAMFVHPLMALPALLLLISLRVPLPVAIGGAVLAVVAAFALPMASSLGLAPKAIVVMDIPWLEVVRERSQFLFLEYWSSSDWEIAARPFVCLTLAALALQDDRITRLCTRAMLIGLTGLIIAFAASATVPVAVLLQGQAWRWMWVTSFASVLLLLPTAFNIWQVRRIGPLCAALLVLGWTCPVVDGLLCVDAALLVWLTCQRITRRDAPHSTGTTRAIIALFRYCTSVRRSRRVLATFCAVLLVTSIVLLKGSLFRLGTVGTPAEIAQFEDWREAIPPSSSVLIVPTGKSAAFSWFTLGRPSYLSVDQSAGVVFSRATALEVRRRSEILLPLADPSWQILSHIKRSRAGRAASGSAPAVTAKPLTAAILANVCGDRALDFVVAHESVGFDPLVHRRPGPWKDWNLYDCRKVREAAPAA